MQRQWRYAKLHVYNDPNGVAMNRQGKTELSHIIWEPDDIYILTTSMQIETASDILPGKDLDCTSWYRLFNL